MAEAKDNQPTPEEVEEVLEQAEAVLEDDQPAEGAQEGAEAGSPTDAEANDELAQAKAEAEAWQGKYMRLHAEWDNYRRRTQEQREVEKARAAAAIVENLIPVVDDFERTVDYAEKNGTDNLLEGVVAVHNKFVDVLGKHGVEVINPVGEAFDALEAQAVAMIPNTEVPDETVMDVYQKGYKLGGKVIRSAMVTVSTGGPKRETEQSDEAAGADADGAEESAE